jgi:EAL domain-containing protein (putative c-di-GMP-specific phosphodiesterase class I)
LIGGQELHITTSIGISTYPNDGGDKSTLIKNADISLYSAKEMGKNQYVLYTRVLKEYVEEEMYLTNELYDAHERNELEIYYQPQVDSHSEKITGFEALLRWNHPGLGLLEPGKFIPIAEKTGLIVKIGEWVLRTACRQNKLWQTNGLIRVPIAVNLSVKQIMSADFFELVMRILNDTGLEPSWLELEITESAIMKNNKSITDTIEKLKNAGIKIAIDDFGTEYSSLSYLKHFPIDRVKIAREFIKEIGSDKKDEYIIQTIVDLLHKLDYHVVAEGVESLDQIDFLQRINCHQVQGYYYSKPVPGYMIDRMLSNADMIPISVADPHLKLP